MADERDQYVTEFVRESESHITQLNNALLDLERSPDDESAIEEIFRSAHTLKGNCGAMGLNEASNLAHALEDLLDAVRAGDVAVTAERMDVFFEAVDALETVIDDVAATGEPTVRTDLEPTIRALRRPLDGDAGGAEADATDGADAIAPTVEPPTQDEIDAVLEPIEPPEDDDVDAYLVRLSIDEGGRADVTNGTLVVQALIDAFDLLGTDPDRETIDDGEYGGEFDAVFASAVGESAIAAALEPVDEVADFEIASVTDEFEEPADETADDVAAGGAPTAGPDEDLTGDVSTDEAQDMSVDELLGEFDELDDLDALVEEVDDADEFDDLGDAGSFDDLLGDDAEEDAASAPEPEAAAESAAEDDLAGSDAGDATDESPDDGSATASEADAGEEDASAVFEELKDEVEMVGFDELQEEIDELDFDEFDDEEEVGMDELLGDDVDADDPAFLSVDEGGESASIDEVDEIDVDEPEAVEAEGDEVVPDAVEPDAEVAADADADEAEASAGADTPDVAADEGVDDAAVDTGDESSESITSDEDVVDAAPTDGATNAEPDVETDDDRDAIGVEDHGDVTAADADETSPGDAADAPASTEEAGGATEAPDEAVDADDASVEADSAPDADADKDAAELVDDAIGGDGTDDAVDADVEGTETAGSDVRSDDANVGIDDEAEAVDESDVATDSDEPSDEPEPTADDALEAGEDDVDTDALDSIDDLEDEPPSDVDEGLAESLDAELDEADTVDEADALDAEDELDGDEAFGEEAEAFGDDALDAGDAFDGDAASFEEEAAFDDEAEFDDGFEDESFDVDSVEGEDALADDASDADAWTEADASDEFADDGSDVGVSGVEAGFDDFEDDADDGFAADDAVFESQDEGTADDFDVPETAADEFDASESAADAFDAPETTADAFEDDDDNEEATSLVDRLDDVTIPDLDIADRSTDGEADQEAQTDRPQSVRVDEEQIDQLLTLVEGLVTSRVRLRHAVDAGSDHAEIVRELDDLEDITSELQETVMEVRLVPLQTVTNRLPRVVRDLARDQEKSVSFEQTGEDVELDRGILDRIGDPLIHLVRNAVDHGIEPPDERESADKSPEGTVELRAKRERNRVRITIEDDGRGLDPDRIRSEAVEADIVTDEEADSLSDEAVLDLVFHSGLSTAGEVTDVSGRGVGMDVVRRTIEDLNGSVSIESEAGEGTTVTMELPVTVAIADVLFLERDGEEFGIPIEVVDDVVDAGHVERADAAEAAVAGVQGGAGIGFMGGSSTNEGGVAGGGDAPDVDAPSGDAPGAPGADSYAGDGTDVESIDGPDPEGDASGADGSDGDGGVMADLPVVDLADAVGTESAGRDAPLDGMVIRIRDEVRPVAIHCDEVRGRQEVVVTPYEGFMSDIPGLSGATVRGRGEVVNILDVTTL